MWFRGTVQIERRVKFEVKRILTRTVWQSPPKMPFGIPLDLNPYEFIFGAIRTAAVGTTVGLRGQLAGGFLGGAAMMYLVISSTSPRTLRLHHRFSNLKDFIGNAFRGNIGAAISYIEMQKQGYTWIAHWEDCYAGGGGGTRPDFVFGKVGAICLVDAKGSTQALSTDLERHTKDEWTRQIRPNLSKMLKGGGVADEGYVISTHIRNSLDANLVVAYGTKTILGIGAATPTKSAKKTPKMQTNSLYSVQRANFISSCRLLGFNKLAKSLDLGEIANLRQFQRIKKIGANGRSYIMGENRTYMYPPHQTEDGPLNSITFMMDEDAFNQSFEKFKNPNHLSDLQLPEFELNTQADEFGAFVLARDGLAIQFSGPLYSDSPSN